MHKGVQSQNIPGLFDAIDQRKCLRCGLNDLIAPNICRYHPAKPKNKLGSEEKHT
jgi:hypothetical protein